MADRKPTNSGIGDWGQFAGHGIQFAVTFGIFAFIGWKLDVWLGTEPWLLLTLLFLGFIGATVSLVKQLPVSDQNKKKP